MALPSSGGSATAALPALERTDPENLFAFAHNGDLFEIQPRAGRLVRHQGTGQVLWTAGTKGLGAQDLDTPVALAVDEQGRSWVLDHGLGRVQRYDARGQFLDTVIQGLSLPFDLVLGPDRVYISESGRRRVLSFSRDGQLIAVISPSAGAFFPKGLALDPLGRLHVVNAGDVRIDVVDAFSGRPLGAYGSPEFLVHPSGIDVNNSFSAVTDGISGDIKIYAADFRLLGVLGVAAPPQSVAFSPLGGLFVHILAGSA